MNSYKAKTPNKISSKRESKEHEGTKQRPTQIHGRWENREMMVHEQWQHPNHFTDITLPLLVVWLETQSSSSSSFCVFLSSKHPQD